MKRNLAAAATGLMIAGGVLAGGVQAQTLRVGLIAQDMGTTDPHRASATQDKAPLSWAYSPAAPIPPG
jgi:hypothetical protein